MALTPGTRLGVYAVTAPLGEGGMGQVWRARDTKLDRDVAIKVLPEAFAHDADRLARFTREAKTLASLNHPHIAGIHGLEESGGITALVMELVEGDDLSQRIARLRANGASAPQAGIPLDEALPIAKQIAEALEAAHEQGIIHRDLKPANIKVRSDGTVKVLDFGLAKALDPAASSSPEAMNSPTITSPAMTQAGVILGTAAYMSPEQARGKPLDKRADIWAFGCVLFEMLTGTRLFAGDSVPETLGLIFSREPDLTTLPAGTPARVRTLVARCLVKDPRQRLRDIGEARLALDGVFETAEPQPATPAPAARSRALVVAAVAVSGLAGALMAWSWVASRAPVPEATTRVSVMVPANRPISLDGSPTRTLALSPDGTELVYVGTNVDGAADPRGRLTQLLVRSLNTLAVRDLPGTTGARQPFFSPDGQWVGFFTQTGELKKIALAGGTPVTLVEQINGSGLSFGVWTAEGVIVFGTISSGLRRVSAEGGAVTDLTTLDAAKGENFHNFPALTPSGQAVLFSVRSVPGYVFRAEAVRLSTGKRRVVLENARPLLVLSSGHLVFQRGDTILVAPFDLDGLAVTGPAVPLVDAVRRSSDTVVTIPTPELAVSRTGTLAYVPATGAATTMGLFGPDGTFETLGPPANDAALPRVSPDGQAIVSLVARGLDVDLQLYDRRRGSTTKLTRDEVVLGAEWHPDGRSLAIASRKKDATGIFLKQLDGRERLLVATPAGVNSLRNASWSPDGSKLAYTAQTGILTDIWVLTMGDPATTTPFLSRPASEHSPAFSPDGRWLAYASDESGQFEVYLQPYPTGERLAVSIGGGNGPVWRRDGKALFYQGLDAGVLKMMAVSVTPDGASLSLGRPTALFDQSVPGGSGAAERYAQSNNVGVAYDVLPDGRFVMVRGADPSGSREFVLVQHWVEELKRLVPAPR